VARDSKRQAVHGVGLVRGLRMGSRQKLEDSCQLGTNSHATIISEKNRGTNKIG
jgi:hypothetical protein